MVSFLQRRTEDETAMHQGRLEDLKKQRAYVLTLSDGERRDERLVYIAVAERVEVNAFPRRLDAARKLGRFEDRVHAERRHGRTVPDFEERRRCLKAQVDRFCLSNVAQPDVERLFKEELRKLRAT